MKRTTQVASPTTGEEYPRYRWVLVSQVWMHWAFGQMIFQTLGIFLPAMQADLGFGPAEAGWLGSLRAVGQLLLFPASIVLVRFSPYWVYGVLLTVAAVAQFFQGAAPGLAVLMIALVIHGIAISWTQITGAFVRLQWVPPKELGTVTGMQMAAGAVTATVLLAGGPVLIAQFGWRAVVLMMDGMLALLALLWWMTKRERVTERYEAAMNAKFEWQNVVTTLRRREFWLLGGAIMGGGGTYFTTVTFLPSYFTADRGMALTTAGAIVSLIPIGGLVASLTTGFLSDRLGAAETVHLVRWPGATRSLSHHAPRCTGMGLVSGRASHRLLRIRAVRHDQRHPLRTECPAQGSRDGPIATADDRDDGSA